MPANTLSVVVCTHNRASDTQDCLDAVYPQIKDSHVALVLVDSASTSPDRERIKSFEQRYPGLTFLRIDEPGLSLARMAAVGAFETEWVAFLDDDAVPKPDWLEKLSGVLEQIPADCGAVGGRILPLFVGSPSRPLRSRQKMYLSINDSVGDRDCSEAFELIAANCCMRRRALLQIGGFPLGMGRLGTKLLSGEDVMVMRKLRQASWRIRYNGTFCVGHKISPLRLTDAWLRERAYWEGVTTLRMARQLGEAGYGQIIAKAMLAAPATGLLRYRNQPEAEWDLRFAFSQGVLTEAIDHAKSAVQSRFGKRSKPADPKPISKKSYAGPLS